MVPQKKKLPPPPPPQLDRAWSGRTRLAVLGSASAIALGLALAAAPVEPVRASNCGDGTVVATGASCNLNVNGFNPVDNDGQVGAAIVNGGDTVTLTGSAQDIAVGSSGVVGHLLGDLDPNANGKERLILGAQTQGISTHDPITGANMVVATYNSSNFQSSDWGQFSSSETVTYVNVGDNQYIDTRLGTAVGGTLIVNVGDANQAPTATANAINMFTKQSTLALASGPSSTVEWVSRNNIVGNGGGEDIDTPPGTTINTITMLVANYAGTFTGFDGQTYTVTNAAELRAYNNRLIAALQSGALSSQAAYDAAFSQAVSFSNVNAQFSVTIDAGDDVAVPTGTNYSMAADGTGATAVLKAGGQIDQRRAPVAALNGGHVEIEAGGQLSGAYNSLYISNGGTAENNGVISSGYFAGDGLDTTGSTTLAGGKYVEAQAVYVTGTGSYFENNGIVNVAAWDANSQYTNAGGPSQMGIYLINNASAINSGIINVGVNNNGLTGDVSGVIINRGNFENTANGIIYIGRAAQYNDASPEVVADTTNSIPEYGIRLVAGQAVNNGTIIVGSKTQNAAAMAVLGSSTGSALINSGSITINGAAGGSPLQNMGMLAQNSGVTAVQNQGDITINGVNGVGIKVLSTGGTAATATTTADSVINVAGGADPASGTRNYGVWVDGQGSGLASASVDGEINLTGIGGIGVHARGKSHVDVSANAVPNFVSGSDQIGFFIYGPDATVGIAASTMDVSTARSTLFRIAEGADLNASGLTIIASGADSTGIVGTGAGTQIVAGTGTFTVSGTGAQALVIEGGATGNIGAGTRIALTGVNSTAGIVDGQKHDLAGNAVGAPDPATRLDILADISSNVTGITGYIARNQGTLATSGDLALTGAGSTGILAEDSGKVLIGGATIAVNGTAAKARRGADSFTITGSTLRGTDALFDTAEAAAATYAASASTLTGVIRTAAGSTADVSVAGATTWNVTGNSNMTKLTNDASTIVFDKNAGSTYKTVTTKDYVGNGGTIVLNTYLDTDGSPSDQLVIDGGTATGTTTLQIVNNAGPGAPTNLDGIRVVDAINGATTDQNAFTLSAPVIAGAWEYSLLWGGKRDPNDQDWYLRNAGINSSTQTVLPYADILGDYAFSTLGTLQQRTGNRIWPNTDPAETIWCKDPARNYRCKVDGAQASVYANGGPVIHGAGAWGRFGGQYSSYDPSGAAGSAYTQRIGFMQAGYEGVVYENSAGEATFGLYGTIGTARADVELTRDPVTGKARSGRISTTGYGVGANLTWLGNNGFYVDAIGQYTWYDSDLSTKAGSNNHGWSSALSLEAGKRFELGSGWAVVPQAQLAWTHVDFESFTDIYGNRNELGAGDSLKGRVGLRLEKLDSWKSADGQLRRMQLYGIANLTYEFLGDTKVDVAGASFAQSRRKLWGELGAGGTYSWNDKWSVYGEASYATALSKGFGDDYTVKGTAGIRYKW